MKGFGPLLLTLHLSFSLVSSCFGQFGLNLRFNPELISNQWFNPAYIHLHSSGHVQLDVGGDFWLGTNRFKLKELVREGNFISEATKDILIGQLSENNRFQQGQDLKASVNLKFGEQNWLLSFQLSSQFLIGVNDSVSAGLLLRGNAPYAGQEISDDEVYWRSTDHWSLGLGSAWNSGPVTWGLHLRFYRGIRAQVLDRLAYSLFTERDGSRIDLEADYDAFSTLADNSGWGAGLDAGLRYTTGTHRHWELSLQNLGFLIWNGSQSTNQVNVQYQGVRWDNFLTHTGSTENLAIGDTLQQLLFPDSVETSFVTPLPASVTIAYIQGNYATGRLSLSISQSLTPYAPQTLLPLVNIGYFKGRKQVQWGANGYVGGLDLYGIGIGIQGFFPLQSDSKLGFYASMPNMLGIVLPDISRGLNLSGGLSLQF